MNNYSIIRGKIEAQLILGKRDFVIYPFGQNGILAKQILNIYGLQEKFIIDNNIAKYNKDIKTVDYLEKVDCKDYTILLATDRTDLYFELVQSLVPFVPVENVIDLLGCSSKVQEPIFTKVGKYSYGPLCSHWLVESVGNFCAFGGGTTVAVNHSMGLISTHPFLYMGKDDVHSFEYKDYRHRSWYFDNVEPMGKPHKLKKIKIGNDVWLGQNVVITNSANIGNGVIGAAGAVITKDVPDYAIVGVPAKIIRFRYTEKQIAALNKIAWWDWSDEKIRECYKDFFDAIDVFIEKHM